MMRYSRRARREKPGEIALSAIVSHELYYGAFKSQRSDRNAALVDEIQFAVLEFDKEDAREAGRVRALLAGAGTPIGPYDVRVAGQAVARKMILVTHNTREFHRVPELRIEDWES